MMMTDMRMDIPLNELYQEVILDHNRNPRNYGKPEKHTHYSHGYNPLCGDDYEVFLAVDASGAIQAARFTGSGCAISKASSSIMTTLIKGRPVDEVRRLSGEFIGMITSGKDIAGDDKDRKRLKVFEGVRRFPIRVKCATLVWHAVQDALNEAKDQ